jgi:hypothetical protein
MAFGYRVGYLLLQKEFPFPTDPTDGDERQHHLGYPLLLSMFSFKPEAFQVSPQCLQTTDALYILPGGVHVWGYVPLLPGPPLHFFFTSPFPNPYIMIPLLQSKATNSDVQNMYELMY